MNRKSCKGCVHHRKIDYFQMACHYMLDTGFPRGCPADKCTKKDTETPLEVFVQNSRLYWVRNGKE